MRDIDKYEDEYIKPDFENYLVAQRRKKVIESIRNSKKILEIGCGMDPLFLHLDWEIDQYYVFEPGFRFYSNAKKLAERSNNIHLINKPFAKCDEIENIDFDAIVCSGLLHEVQHPIDLLLSIKAVSNENTLIHINVPNANSFHRLLAKEMHLINDVKEFSERNIRLQQNTIFDLNLLSEMCHSVGLNIINQGSYFIKPFTHDQMKQMMDSHILDSAILDGLYTMTKYMPELGSEIFVDCKIS